MENPSTPDCAICLEPLLLGSWIDKLQSSLTGGNFSVHRTSPCNHLFHKSCLHRWQNQPRSNAQCCPVCRRKYKPIKAPWAERAVSRLEKTAAKLSEIAFLLLGLSIVAIYPLLLISSAFRL